MDDLWLQIVMVIVAGFLAWKILPGAIYAIKNGPRGSSKEWFNVSVLMAAVVLFVTFLIVMVRG